jgi:DeoR family fructose operon transcriptional repressor
MFAHERSHLILRLLRQSGRLSFDELRSRLDVSAATLRRDLTALAKAGELVRVHGGVLDPARLRGEMSLDERTASRRTAKKAIGLLASALVRAGDCVLVDAGSTCLQAALNLLGREDVTLVTNSLPLLEAGRHGRCRLICLGGELRRVSGALTGAASLGMLDRLQGAVAFVGASGLAAGSGASTTELSESAFKQTLLQRARRRVLLADASKWDQPSLVRFAGWEEFTDMVTDRRPKEPLPGHLQLHLPSSGAGRAALAA